MLHAGNRSALSVYDLNSFHLRRGLAIPPCGEYNQELAACPVNQFIYLSDWNKKSIHSLQATDAASVFTWSVGANPFGIHVTTRQTVLVACYHTHSLREYTSQGVHVREVKLVGVQNPWHAVQLPSGQLVVSRHDGALCRLNERGSKVEEVSQIPCNGAGLTLSADGCIIIGAYGNSKVLVANPDLSQVVELPGDFRSPHNLCLETSRGQLFVGERSRGKSRIGVIDGVFKLLPYLNSK